MPQKTAGIKPKNGRWSTNFLNEQMKKLVLELSECETWSKRSIINLREPVEDYVIAGNEADRAPVDMRHYVSSLELECSTQKITSIQTALVVISRDFKSDCAHNYGKCIDCERFIALPRLMASPWAQKCLGCQKASEPDFRRERRYLKVRPSSLRTHKKIHRQITKTQRLH